MVTEEACYHIRGLRQQVLVRAPPSHILRQFACFVTAKMKIPMCFLGFGLVAGGLGKGLARHAWRNDPLKAPVDRTDHGQTNKYIIETEPVSKSRQ